MSCPWRIAPLPPRYIQGRHDEPTGAQGPPKAGLLAAEGAELVHLLNAAGVAPLWPPLGARHYPWLDQFQAGEEGGDLLRGAQSVRGRRNLVPLPYRLDHPLTTDLARGCY